ncbi:hypothetical protein N9K47_00240, partial [bacterium]|nr:hypothetical protein [bacterium]
MDLLVTSATPEGVLRMSSTAALTDRLGNAGVEGSLSVPSSMEFTVDKTPPTAQVASIEPGPDDTVTLTLEADERIVPPTIFLSGCEKNCKFVAEAVSAHVPLSELFQTTHIYTYKKDEQSPEGTFPLTFDSLRGFDAALNQMTCSHINEDGSERCEPLGKGKLSCFMTDGNPCTLTIDKTAPELEHYSVSTSNTWGDTRAKVGDTVTIEFSVSEELHPDSPVLELVGPSGGVGMFVTPADSCDGVDSCLDYIATLTVDDTITIEGDAGVRLSLMDTSGNEINLEFGPHTLNPEHEDAPAIVIDTTAPVVHIEARTTKLYSVYKFNLDPQNNQQGLRDWDNANSVQLAEITLFGLDGMALHDGLTCTNPGGNNPSVERPEDACDGLTPKSNAFHKWLDFNKGDLIMTYDRPVAVAAWDWRTANDAAERDPTRWSLEGSNNGRSWTVLDSTPSEFRTSRDRDAWQGPFEIASHEVSQSSLLAGGNDLVSVVVTTNEAVHAVSVQLTTDEGHSVQFDDIPVDFPPYAVEFPDSEYFTGFASAVLDLTGLEVPLQGVFEVTVTGVVDLVGNSGSDAHAMQTVAIDTTSPVVSVSIVADDDASFVVAPTDNTKVTVTGEVLADEPVTMPYVVVAGVPVATKPVEADQLSVGQGLMLSAVFSWADVDMNGFLSYAESQYYVLVAIGPQVAAEFDAATYGRVAGQVEANVRMGLTPEDLKRLYDGETGWWSNKMRTLSVAYNVLIGYDVVAPAWEFEYTFDKNQVAGELAIHVRHSEDLSGNVGDEVTSASTPLTVLCATGYWSDGTTSCTAHTVCTRDEHSIPVEEQCIGGDSCSGFTSGDESSCREIDGCEYIAPVPSAVADRVCEKNTVCKSVDFYSTKAALTSLLDPSLVERIGVVYLDSIGAPAIARLKSLLANDKGTGVETWLMAQDNFKGDTEALQELVTALSDLPLQYMAQPATDTQDTVCEPVQFCSDSTCQFQLRAPTGTENTECSAPCAGHGECDGAGVCTCWPTCSGTDGNACNTGTFETTLETRVEDNCPDECAFEEWVGGQDPDYKGRDTRCRVPKVVGCTTLGAENFDKRANYDTGTVCQYNACKVKPCQRGGTCLHDISVDAFECDCPDGYSGDRCERIIPRYTSPANSILRGPNLAGAESGSIGLLELIPVDQFNEPRQYSDFEEAAADLDNIDVSFLSLAETATDEGTIKSVRQQADGSFTFGIAYSVEISGGADLDVQLAVKSKLCIETAGASTESDATACAEVEDLSSDSECLDVQTADGQGACEYQPLFRGSALDLVIASGIGPASSTTSEVAQISTGTGVAGQAATFEITLIDAYGTPRSEACPEDCDTSTDGLAVSAKKNLALGQLANQSSTGWGGLAARGVDGNADSNYGANSCIRSDGNPAWWQVDLGITTNVETVVVTQDHLVGARIYVGSSALTPDSSFPDGGDGWDQLGVLETSGGVETKIAESALSGRYVVVHMDTATSTGQHMTLCEVEVYGSTPVDAAALFQAGATGGSFLASWTAEMAGQYRLEFSLDGLAFGCTADGTCDYEQVQTVLVESARTSPQLSVVTRGDDLFEAEEVRLQAGTSMEFRVTAKDAYGNENEDGTKGGELAVGLKGGQVTVTRDGGGKYNVVVAVGPKGTYELELKIGGVDLFSHTKQILVSSGPATAMTSVVQGLAPRGTAGEQEAVFVVPRDQFGTLCSEPDGSEPDGEFVLLVGTDASTFPPATAGEDSLDVERQMTWISATCVAAVAADNQLCADVDLSDPTECEAVPTADDANGAVCNYTPGHYTSGTFDLNTAGIYLTAVVLSTDLGEAQTQYTEVSSSGTVIRQVRPSTVSAAASSLSDYSSQETTAGETEFVEITLMDEFSNELEYDVRSVQESFYATATTGIMSIGCDANNPCMCSAAQTVEADSFCVVNMQNGKFQVKYSFATAATYSVEIRLARDDAVIGDAFPVTVTAGALSAIGSIIATAGPGVPLDSSNTGPSAVETVLTGEAGVEREWYIHARDAYGNEISALASEFEPSVSAIHLTQQLTLLTQPVVVVEPVENRPGIVHVSITFKTVGDYVVASQLSGALIGSEEVSASVSHAPASATESRVLPGWKCVIPADADGSMTCNLDGGDCPVGCDRVFVGLNTVETVAYMALRDSFGNVVATDTLVTMTANVNGIDITVNGEPTDPPVPGKYMFSHLFDVAGTVEGVLFHVDGEALQPSYDISINTGIGHVDAESSLVMEPDAPVDVAGVPTEFFIEARDSEGILATGADCARVELQLQDSGDRCLMIEKDTGDGSRMCEYISDNPNTDEDEEACVSVPCAGSGGESVPCVFEGSVSSDGGDPGASVTVTGVIAGKYTAEFTAEKKGTYTITISLAGDTVGTIVREVGAAAPAGAMSIVVEDTTEPVVAGAPTSFTVKMYDQYNNEIDTLRRQDDHLIKAVYGKTELAVSRSTSTAGAYEVLHEFERAWSCPNCFVIQYDGIGTQHGPYTLTVVAGGLDPARSLVRKAVGGKPMAGSLLSLMVITRDQFGNPRTTSAGASVGVTLAMVDTLGTNTISADDALTLDDCATAVGEDNCAAAGACQYTPDTEEAEESCSAKGSITVIDTSDGHYAVNYAHHSAGTYRLDVSVDEHTLAAAAFQDDDNTVTISPGTVSLREGDTLVEGDGKSVASAGDETSFTVRARDEYHNVILDSSVPIQAGLTFDETCKTCKFTGAKAVFSDGVFTFTYTATALGDYLLNVKIGGASVFGSPFNVEVMHGTFDLAKTSEQVTVTTSFSAGQEVAVTVDPCDKYGNTVPATSCRGAEHCATNFAESVTGDISSCPAECTYTEHVPGIFSFAVNDANQETVVLINPIIQEEMDPGSAFAGQMVGRFNGQPVDGRYEVQTAGSYTLAVSYNVFSEACTPTNSITTCVLESSPDVGQSCTPSGTGECTYVPQVDHVLTGDVGIPLVASPAEISPEHCVLSFTEDAIIAGQAAVASLRTYDMYGNAIAVGGASVEGSDTDGNDIATVTDLANADDSVPGMYTISYTSTDATEILYGHMVMVSVNGVSIWGESSCLEERAAPRCWDVVVLPGSVSTNSQFAGGSEDSDRLSDSITAGTLESFTVLALDMYGNEAESTSADFAITVRSSSGTTYRELDTATDAGASASTWQVSFTPILVGVYEVIVTLASSGEAINGPADATVQVVADMALSPETCVVEWSSGLVGGLVGQVAKIHVYLTDQYGNPQPSPHLVDDVGTSEAVTMAISSFVGADGDVVDLTHDAIGEDDPRGYKFTLALLVGAETGSCSADGPETNTENTCVSSGHGWTWELNEDDGIMAGLKDVTISVTHADTEHVVERYHGDTAVSIASGLAPISATETTCLHCSRDTYVVAGVQAYFELEVRDQNGVL